MGTFGIENYIAQVSIDCVVFGYEKKELKVLISKFKFGDDIWALPGGHIFKNESLDDAASRILKERTKIENIYLEQFRVFGSSNRVKSEGNHQKISEELSEFFNAEELAWFTQRFISIGYYALVDIEKFNPKESEFDDQLVWQNIKETPEMIYDHSEILDHALEALQLNLDRKLIGFNLLPETFTMRELHELYEAVYDRKIVINNFQTKILNLDVLDRLDKKYTGAANKAPYLYRFKK